MKSITPLKIAVLLDCCVALAFSSISGAANLSLSAVAYQTSSNYIPAQAGNFSYDGLLSTKWTSNAAPNQWISLDLGQNSNVTSVVLKLASSCGTCDPATYNLKNYEIQTATSFSGPWISKGTFSNPGQAAITTHNLIFSARYIRLYVTNAGIDQHVRLPEFEIHGSYAGAPNAPASLQVIAPTCTNGTATFAWSNSGNAWILDISKTVNGNFDPNNFFNKNVSNTTSTTGPGGFTSYLINGQVNTGQSLTFQPGQWYSWRIWNGSVHTYGPTFQAPVCNQPPPSSTCRNIYGIHFWEPSAANIMNGKKGWTVEIVNTEDGQNGGWGINNAKNLIQQIRNQGVFEPIVRIDKNWGKNVPNSPADFAAFANDCKNVVQQLAAAPYYVKWFTIGNEPNLAGENSANAGNNGKGVPADVYAACFKQCYNVIKPAVPQAKIMVAGPGTFNAQGPLSASTGAGVYYDVYFERVVTQVGNLSDGYAIHGYGLANTQSADNNLQAAYKNSNAWEFDCFKVYMAILAKYSYAKTKAVHITETNTNSHGNLPSSSYYSGWMQQAYAKIQAWNQTAGKQQIQSLCWFVYKDYGGWGDYSLLTQTGNMGQARSDFNALTAGTNYKPANCPGQLSVLPGNSAFIPADPIDPLLQCLVSIPNHATVISTTGTLLAGGEVAWVCEGGSVTDMGGADTIYLEKNSTCTSNGGGAVIFAKTGSTVTLNGGSEQVIYEAGVVINNIGGASQLISCSTLIYDYTKAPVVGCSTLSVNNQNDERRISIYPNPVSDIMNIELPGWEKNAVAQVRIINPLGLVVYSASLNVTSGQGKIDVRGFPKGIYVLSSSNEEHIHSSLFIVK